MKPLPRPAWRTAPHCAALAVLTTLAALLLPTTGAQAAERTVRGGRLDWGIKSSFQSYVTGPIAQGSWSLTGGAATVGGSQFRFHSATGTYDPGSGALRAGFSGGVRFLGHRKSSGAYELDLTISRPTVRVSGGTGTLYADMTSKARGSGQVSTRSQVPLASLGLSGIDTRGGAGTLGLARLPATLTAQGASAFAGYYTAGTALDPVTLSVDVLAETRAGAGAGKGAKATPTAEPSSSPGKKKDGDPAGGKPKARSARIEDAAVDWGVRRTFREYVTGPIAKGAWKLASGARDGGALFRFPKGEGTYDPGKGTLDADFAGSVRFTGEHGLDLTLREVHVDIAKGRGTLRATVDSPDHAARKLPLVTFAAGAIETGAGGGLATLTEAPARLTPEGAEAFGGMYRPGTAMDPVSLAVALDADASLPPLPDLGSDATPSPAAAPATSASPGTGAAAPTASSSSATALPVGIGAGAGVLLLAAGGYWLVRRRRTAAPQPEATAVPGSQG
ncbi:HtaA domain-containing protein [Streptomyces sp. NPDC007088]|uniref:HtaA domain-containing protein n=1 Tax=Streptomyces sp. NPDC007088 TaxID=3364773 RepID=UPI0036C8DC0F